MVTKTDIAHKQAATSLTTGDVKPNTQEQVSPANLRRNEKLASDLHKAPETATHKTFKGAAAIVNAAADSGTNIFSSLLGKGKSIINRNKGNKGVRDIFFGLLVAGFGLTSVKNLFSLPKILSEPGKNTKKSPIIFTGAKILTGSAIALGLLKSIMGGVGLGLPGLIFGVATFFGLNLLTSTFENPEGAPAKIAKMFGIKDKVTGLMNNVRIFGRTPESLTTTT